MMEILFNPFEDRADRDVRNLLGSAFVSALENADPTPVEQAVSDIGDLSLSCAAQSFIKARVQKYSAILAQIKADPFLAKDRFAIAGQLWDESLFFECHEWLEQGYRDLEGREKKIRQAMIRTAGTFEHLAYNRIKPAVSVAAKALAVLEPNLSQVPGAFNVRPKMARLKAVLDGFGH